MFVSSEASNRHLAALAKQMKMRGQLTITAASNVILTVTPMASPAGMADGSLDGRATVERRPSVGSSGSSFQYSGIGSVSSTCATINVMRERQLSGAGNMDCATSRWLKTMQNPF